MDILDDRLILLVHSEVDQIAHIFADHLFISWHHHDFEAIDLLEFEGFGVSRSCHASQTIVKAEIILKGY